AVTSSTTPGWCPLSNRSSRRVELRLVTFIVSETVEAAGGAPKSRPRVEQRTPGGLDGSVSALPQAQPSSKELVHLTGLVPRAGKHSTVRFRCRSGPEAQKTSLTRRVGCALSQNATGAKKKPSRRTSCEHGSAAISFYLVGGSRNVAPMSRERGWRRIT